MAGSLSRRRFLALAGAGLAAACGESGGSAPTEVPPTDTPIPTPVPTLTPVPETLRLYADRAAIELGVELPSLHILQPQIVGKGYLNLAPANFNLLQCSDFIWSDPYRNPLRPTQDRFDFTRQDASADFAQKNGMRLSGLHLVWGSKNALPDWLTNGNFNQADLMAILETHIRTAVGHFKGRVNEWTVVNELLGTPWQAGNSFWYDRLGAGFVESAFNWANESDPSATLLYSDFGIEIPGIPLYYADRDALATSLITGLRARGAPIHGVAFELHLYATDFESQPQRDRNTSALARQIEKYQRVGVGVYVTELDVRLNKVTGSQEERFEIQAAVYRVVCKACLDAGVKSITIFGVTDNYSWLEDKNALVGTNADPLLFDEKRQPKPAYYAMLDVLRQAAQGR